MMCVKSVGGKEKVTASKRVADWESSEVVMLAVLTVTSWVDNLVGGKEGAMDAMAGKMADGELSAMGGSLMSCSEEAILVLWRQFTEWLRWVLRLCWSTACPVG